MRPDLLAGLFLAFPGKNRRAVYFSARPAFGFASMCLQSFFYAFEKKRFQFRTPWIDK